MTVTGSPNRGIPMAAGEGSGSSAGARSRLPVALAVALAVLACDQLSKFVILEYVMDPPRAIEILPFFNLVLVHNRGVSFGLFGSDSVFGPYLLSALALAVSVALGFWARRAETRLLAVALGGIIGGAVGNVIDRLRFGAVVDFLDFYLPGTSLPHWPAFNVADSAIVVGVALILADSLFAGPRKPK